MAGNRQVCGKPRSDGKPCGYRSGPCPHHPAGQSEGHAGPDELEEGAAAPARANSQAKGDRSLPDLGWWLIDQALEGKVTPAMLSSIGGIMCLLATQPGVDDADTLREVELRGRLMHGLPPREEEEWELARALFDDDAMAEFQRWQDEMDRKGPNPPTDDSIEGWT